MKYAITGHKGLIGRKLKERLDSEGHSCRMSVDSRESAMNVMYMKDCKVEEVDVLFHLAAFCKINKTIENPSLAFENNVQGTYNVLEFCRRNKIPKIVFFSSSRVLSPEKNPYTASKIYGEELVKAYSQCYGLEYLIIRPSTVYGGEDKTHRLMDTWIKNAQMGRPLIIYGDENKTLDFTHIDDFIVGVMYTLKGEWNKEYNISGKKELKLIDVAKEIISQANTKSKIIFKKPELAQPQRVKVECNVDYTPKVDIKEGIKRELK